MSAHLKERLESLCGGKVLLLSSFTTAVHHAVMTLARAGDEIVASARLAPNTLLLLRGIVRDMGIETEFVASAESEDFEAVLSARTRFVYVNASYASAAERERLAAIAAVAHSNKIPLVVAALAGGPLALVRQHADVLVLDLAPQGADDGTGGAVVDMGRFDWRTGNVPLMKAADPCCDDIRWAFDLPKEKAPYAFAARMEGAICRVLSSELPEAQAAEIEARLAL